VTRFGDYTPIRICVSASPGTNFPKLGAAGVHAQKGPEGPFARPLRYDPLKNTSQILAVSRPFIDSALGLDDCFVTTKRSHWVRFPAGAPHPRVGLLVAGHHREGSPTLRVTCVSKAGVRGHPDPVLDWVPHEMVNCLAGWKLW
jgi:hypothetical protein